MARTTTRDMLRAIMPVLNKKPTASMDDIATGLHMGRATLFRHFGSRDGLMRALMLESYAICQEIMRPLLTLDAPASDRLERVIRGLVPTGALFCFLLYEPWRLDDAEMAEADAAYRADWEGLLEDWRVEGGLAADVPLSWAGRCIDVLLWTAWTSLDAGETALKNTPDLVLRVLRGGLGAQNIRTEKQ